MVFQKNLQSVKCEIAIRWNFRVENLFRCNFPIDPDSRRLSRLISYRFSESAIGQAYIRTASASKPN